MEQRAKGKTSIYFPFALYAMPSTPSPMLLTLQALYRIHQGGFNTLKTDCEEGNSNS